MNKQLLLPLLAAAGGAAAAVLRLMQNRTGFEPDTGLAIPGNVFALLVPVLLAALGLALWLAARSVPDEREDPPASFEAAFAAPFTLPVTLAVAGVFLIALSGLWQFYEVLALSAGRAGIAGGVTALVTAAGLLPAAVCCRSGGRRESDSGDLPPAQAVNPNLLLLAPVCLVVRLVLTYREISINPSLGAYYVQVLALVMMTLAFYRLSSFGFRAGRSRRFALYASWGIVLCLTALADGQSVDAALLCGGGAAALMGFLLQRLLVCAARSEQ